LKESVNLSESLIISCFTRAAGLGHIVDIISPNLVLLFTRKTFVSSPQLLFNFDTVDLGEELPSDVSGLNNQQN